MKPSIINRREATRLAQKQARAEEIRRVNDNLDRAIFHPGLKVPWGAGWVYCGAAAIVGAGHVCIGTGRMDICQTCRLATPPWAWLGDDGYYHCPHCAQRLLGQAFEDWPRGGNGSCWSCKGEWRKP